MSFKRDGDDRCALDSLRKRRVADLLYEDIEENEVSKIKNGRYVCKLCSHKPIFDTLSMFQVHKQGKKHQASMLYLANKDQELAALIEKRKHESFVKTGNSDIKQASVNLTKDPGRIAPYDPRSKRNRNKPYDRKLKVELHEPLSPSEHLSVSTETTKNYQLPGNRFLDTNNYPEQMKYKLKSMINAKDMKDACKDIAGISKNVKDPPLDRKCHPLDRKCHPLSISDNDDEVLESEKIKQLVGEKINEQRNKFYLARKQDKFNFRKINPKPGTEEPSEIKLANQSWAYYKNWKGPNKMQMNTKSKGDFKTSCGVSMHGVKSVIPKDKIVPEKLNPVTGEKTAQQSNIVEKRTRAEKLLEAFGSGWKKDWDGKWIRDDEAEFDSDDEPPHVS